MYQVVDGAPVRTSSGRTITPPRGTASVVRMEDRYAIVVGQVEPIIVTAGEFHRLMVEGQLRFVQQGLQSYN